VPVCVFVCLYVPVCVPVCVSVQLSSVLSCEVHTSQSGRHIAAKLMELVVNHFSLSSTTVTGIPMKVAIEQ